MNRSLRRVRHRLPTCPHIDNEGSAFAFGFQFQFPSVSLQKPKPVIFYVRNVLIL